MFSFSVPLQPRDGADQAVFVVHNAWYLAVGSANVYLARLFANVDVVYFANQLVFLGGSVPFPKQLVVGRRIGHQSQRRVGNCTGTVAFVRSRSQLLGQLLQNVNHSSSIKFNQASVFTFLAIKYLRISSAEYVSTDLGLYIGRFLLDPEDPDPEGLKYCRRPALFRGAEM